MLLKSSTIYIALKALFQCGNVSLRVDQNVINFVAGYGLRNVFIWIAPDIKNPRNLRYNLFDAMANIYSLVFQPL